MRYCFGLLAALLVCSSAVALPRAQEPNYSALAQRFLERHQAAEVTPELFDLHGELARHYLHARVGIFDLYLPPSGMDAKRTEDFQALCLAMLRTQEAWLDWLAPASGSLRTVRKDLATLSKWVKAWKTRDLAAAAEIEREGGDLDVLAVLGAKASVREASDRFGQAMALGVPLGMERREEVREPIVLIHERLEFLEFLCFGAWLHDHLRSVFWRPEIANWTHFYVDDVKVLALEFAAPGRSPGDLSSGVDMNARTPTGMEQQIVQLASNSMIANYFRDSVPPALAGAMAVNLVIDQYGECNTRVDGDLRARRSAAREVFVPGGQSEGGVLPPNLADSRWRDGHGSDHFVRVLRQALRAGKGNRKTRSGARKGARLFELKDDNEVSRTTIAAPFLGSAAALREEPPARFYGDHLEFLRSYRSCFVHWMQSHAAGSSKASKRAYGQLLIELANAPNGADVEAILGSVYDGAPLSDVEPNKKALEVRFLTWLARQK